MAHDLRTFVEIKYANERVHQLALDGEIVTYYYAQIQHQLLVTGLPEAHYLTFNDQSFNGRNQYALLTVVADPNYQCELLALEREFWDCVRTDTPPSPWWVGWYKAKGQRTWEMVSQSFDEREAFRLLLDEADRRKDKSSESVVLIEGKHPFKKAERQLACLAETR